MINHSFVLLAFKDSPYLSDCLDSLKNQTIESHIVIATSTPSVYISNIADEYGVELFVMKSGNGIAYDWNKSILKATTKYVTLAHQDDLYDQNYTESCLNASGTVEDTLICFTGYSEIVNRKERSSTLLLQVKRLILLFFMPFKKNLHSKFWKRRFLSFGCPIAAPSVMYNMEKLSGFKFSDEFSINMDWDAWTRMANMEGQFVYVGGSLLKHRIHSDSATTLGLKSNSRQSEDLKMFKRFWPSFFAKLLAKLYSISYKSNQNRVPK